MQYVNISLHQYKCNILPRAGTVVVLHASILSHPGGHSVYVLCFIWSFLQVRIPWKFDERNMDYFHPCLYTVAQIDGYWLDFIVEVDFELFALFHETMLSIFVDCGIAVVPNLCRRFESCRNSVHSTAISNACHAAIFPRCTNHCKTLDNTN